MIDLRCFAGCRVAATLLVVATVFLGGCTLETSCDCIASGVEVEVEVRKPATRMTLSGVCTDAQVECRGGAIVSEDGLCGGYQRVHPNAPGTCGIRVEFDDGTEFSTEVEIYRSNGCCGPMLHPKDHKAVVAK